METLGSALVIMCDNSVCVKSKENARLPVFAMVLVTAVCFAPVRAAVNPKSLSGDSRLGELIYDRDQVFHIQVAKGIATHIILGADEKILASAPGAPADCSRTTADWCIVANTGAHELYVQPRTSLSTRNNLQLTTTLRRYSFEFVQSTGVQAAQEPWYRVSFRYEPDASRSAAPDLAAAKGQLCNWNYSMSTAGNATRIAPLAVFDDGRDTYLMLPPGNATPTVDGELGKEDLRTAPGMAAGQLLMLPSVRGSFTIRSGLAAITVWNDGITAPPTSACPVW